jgi:hypothetical protein
LEHHLDTYAQPGRLGLVFVGEKGAPLRRCNFSDKWATALEVAGLADVHFTTYATVATPGRRRPVPAGVS